MLVKHKFKTKITVILAVIIYIILMGITIYGVTPFGECDVVQITRDEKGYIYVMSISENEVVVDRMDAEGYSDRFYRCGLEAQDAQLLFGYYEGKIYIAQVWHEVDDLGHAVDTGQHFSIWETEVRGFRCILEGTIDNETTFTDMRVDRGGIRLAGTDLQTREVVTYRYQERELLVQRYMTDFIPHTVCFGASGLYVLSDQNQMYLLGYNENSSSPVQNALGEVAAVFTDENGVYWQNKGSKDLKCLHYEGAQGFTIQNMGVVQDVAYSEAAQNYTIILQEDGEQRIVVINRDGEGNYIDTVEMDNTGIIKNALTPMGMITVLYVAVGAAFMLIVRFLRHKSRLLYKTLVSISALSGICLVVMIVIINFHEGGNYQGMNLAIIAFAEWIVVMVIAMLFLGHIWKNMDIVLTWMDRISKGEYDIESRKAPDNDFGIMWTALERMCRKLRVQKYRYDETVEYLYRYAPRNFEQLFDKETLQEIRVGETRQLPATLGIISVIDKETLLTGKTQKQYMQYINKLLDLLFSQRESEQAVFLQDGSSLENVKAVFRGERESAIAALQYSVECMEALLLQTEVQYGTAPFILLHTAKVSCGLSGGSRQVYPYVASLEMESLGRYADRLRRSGLKIVMTEETWQFIKENAEGRYIGYVMSADRRYTFRLYEVFDACPQPQKLARLKNRERFAQALELFYNNDLYLARSAFADVLKECPDDGICGWYVFACDKMFDDETAEKRYELFGREEFR